MESINLTADWIGILLGFISGCILGLFFHREEWLGGYGSWPRRLARLGHISFFGLAAVNFLFAVTVRVFEVHGNVALPSYLFVLAAITMPLVCYLAAFYKPLRHLFFIPVLCLIFATSHLIFFGLATGISGF